jgi:DNA-binding response OmpR family regulator
METRINILIVDSDTEAIDHISSILGEADSDWGILTLSSGKECLDIISNEDYPDVVILGMELKDMTGIELTVRIRDYSDVPVILLSNERELYTLVKAFDSGVNDFVFTPFNEAIFIARIKALVRRREWDRQSKA